MKSPFLSPVLAMLVLLVGAFATFPAAATYHSPYDQPGDDTSMIHYRIDSNGSGEFDRIGIDSTMTTMDHFVGRNSYLLTIAVYALNADAISTTPKRAWSIVGDTDSILADVYLNPFGTSITRITRTRAKYRGAEVLWRYTATGKLLKVADTLHVPMSIEFAYAVADWQKQVKADPWRSNPFGLQAESVPNGCRDTQITSGIQITGSIIGFIVGAIATEGVSALTLLGVAGEGLVTSVHTKMTAIHEACTITGHTNPFPPGGPGREVGGAL